MSDIIQNMSDIFFLCSHVGKTAENQFSIFSTENTRFPAPVLRITLPATDGTATAIAAKSLHLQAAYYIQPKHL